MRPPVDFERRIRRSRRRSLRLALLVALGPAFSGLFAGLVIAGWVLFGLAQEPGLVSTYWWVFPAVVVGMMVFLMLLDLPVTIWILGHARALILDGMRARDPNSLEETMLADAVSEVCIAAHIGEPSLAVIDERSPNALVVGTPRNAVIVVTTGLLEILDRAALEAVVGHLVARIIGGDLRYFMFLAATTMNVDDCATPRGFAAGGVFDAAAAPAKGVARWAISSLSRERALLADDQAVDLVRDPWSLVTALQKIEHDTCEHSGLPRGLAFMFFVDPAYPETVHNAGNLFYRTLEARRPTQSHPAVGERIAHLRALLT